MKNSYKAHSHSWSLMGHSPRNQTSDRKHHSLYSEEYTHGMTSVLTTSSKYRNYSTVTRDGSGQLVQREGKRRADSTYRRSKRLPTSIYPLYQSPKKSLESPSPTRYIPGRLSNKKRLQTQPGYTIDNAGNNLSQLSEEAEVNGYPLESHRRVHQNTSVTSDNVQQRMSPSTTNKRGWKNSLTLDKMDSHTKITYLKNLIEQGLPTISQSSKQKIEQIVDMGIIRNRQLLKKDSRVGMYDEHKADSFALKLGLQKLARLSPMNNQTDNNTVTNKHQEFQFFQFNKVQVVLKSFVLDNCIAVTDCLLRDDEIDELLEMIKGKTDTLRSLVLRNALSPESNAYFWSQLFDKKIVLRALETIVVDGSKMNAQMLFKCLRHMFSEDNLNVSPSGGSPPMKSRSPAAKSPSFGDKGTDSEKAQSPNPKSDEGSSMPQKERISVFVTAGNSLGRPSKLDDELPSERSPVDSRKEFTKTHQESSILTRARAREVSLCFREVDGKEFFDTFHAEKFLFEQQHLRIKSVEVSRSPMLFNILENGAASFKHLKRLMISDTTMENSYLSFQLAAIKTLKYLHFHNVENCLTSAGSMNQPNSQSL